jgi:hypothetical protein
MADGNLLDTTDLEPETVAEQMEEGRDGHPENSVQKEEEPQNGDAVKNPDRQSREGDEETDEGSRGNESPFEPNVMEQALLVDLISFMRDPPSIRNALKTYAEELVNPRFWDLLPTAPRTPNQNTEVPITQIVRYLTSLMRIPLSQRGPPPRSLAPWVTQELVVVTPYFPGRKSTDDAEPEVIHKPEDHDQHSDTDPDGQNSTEDVRSSPPADADGGAKTKSSGSGGRDGNESRGTQRGEPGRRGLGNQLPRKRTSWKDLGGSYLEPSEDEGPPRGPGNQLPRKRPERLRQGSLRYHR